MPNYRRRRIPGGTYFFTVNLAGGAGALLIDRLDLLREVYATTHRELPFETRAIVIMPDHLHAVWTLPPGDADFSVRWGRIKGRFSHALRVSPPRSRSQIVKRERGIWQRRFWEHAVRDERDFEQCVSYCWIDPVRHGLARRATDWPHSSFHREVRKGVIGPQWCGPILEGAFGERA